MNALFQSGRRNAVCVFSALLLYALICAPASARGRKQETRPAADADSTFALAAVQTDIDAYIGSLIAESTADFPAWNMEKKRAGRKSGWDYIDGCMIMSLLELYRTTHRAEYLAFSDMYVGSRIADDGSIASFNPEAYNLDNINAGKNLFTLYALTGKEKYNKALDPLYAQIQKQPRTQEQNFWHKRSYPDQVWLDGLYMVMPFYMEYAYTRFGAGTPAADKAPATPNEPPATDSAPASDGALPQQLEEIRADIYRQFFTVEQHMRDSKTGLYYHGYDASRSVFWADKKTGLSENFWLRSLGWFSMAMLDTIAADAHNDPQKDHLLHMFVSLMEALLGFQGDNGLWMQLPALDGKNGRPEKAGNYYETSGSAILSYCLLKASRPGILAINGETAARFRAAGEKAFAGLCREKLRISGTSFHLDGICLSAGLGPASNTTRDGSADYYLREPVVSDDAKGAGPFLLAYAQMCLLQKDSAVLLSKVPAVCYDAASCQETRSEQFSE